jgi:hypothetical protein
LFLLPLYVPNTPLKVTTNDIIIIIIIINQ